MRGIVALVALGMLAVTLPMPTQAGDSFAQREYLGGGSFFGKNRVCMGSSFDFDIGGVCDMPCGPDKVCEITVVDDENGSDVWFFVCVNGEGFCRFAAFHGSGTVHNAAVIAVVIEYDDATTGIVTVR